MKSSLLYMLLSTFVVRPIQCRMGVRWNDLNYVQHQPQQQHRHLFDMEYQNMMEERYNISSEQFMRYIIPQQYIIAFDFTIDGDSTTNSNGRMVEYITNLLRQNNFMNATVLWYYDYPSIQALTISNVNNELYTIFELDPHVVLIEPDVIVTLDTVSTSNWQPNPPNWGLDRIDQLSLFHHSEQESPLDHRYNFDQTGKGVAVFIVDTGMRWGHEEFHNDPNTLSRVICGFDAYNHNPEHDTDDWDNGCYDGVGHGTHIAAIVGGSVYGVAKDVTLVSVKVFTSDGRGSVGSVLAGLDYVLKKKETVTDVIGMVVNLSFGTPIRLNILDQMISDIVVSKGMVVTASAGNEATDACTKYPSGMNNVISVGSSNINDTISSYTNIGPCIDIFAPGEQITSAWRDSNIDRATISGTSQAAAFVAGVVALLYEFHASITTTTTPAVTTTMTPDDIKKYLQDMAEVDVLSGISPDGNSPTRNLLLNMGRLELAT